MVLTPPPLRHTQTHLTLKQLDLLVIHCPALTAGIAISRPQAAPGKLLGVPAQPDPQGGIRILRAGCDRFVALGGAMLPGDAAGNRSLTPKRPLEGGRTAARRHAADLELPEAGRPTRCGRLP